MLVSCMRTPFGWSDSIWRKITRRYYREGHECVSIFVAPVPAGSVLAGILSFGGEGLDLGDGEVGGAGGGDGR